MLAVEIIPGIDVVIATELQQGLEVTLVVLAR
jgi:hypothetical protein